MDTTKWMIFCATGFILNAQVALQADSRLVKALTTAGIVLSVAGMLLFLVM